MEFGTPTGPSESVCPPTASFRGRHIILGGSRREIWGPALCHQHPPTSNLTLQTQLLTLQNNRPTLQTQSRNASNQSLTLQQRFNNASNFANASNNTSNNASNFSDASNNASNDWRLDFKDKLQHHESDTLVSSSSCILLAFFLQPLQRYW